MNNNYHLVIVDDDLEDHLILEEYFRICGLQGSVKFLQNGQDAIDYLQEVSDNSLLPKLIVLDLNMPILNGTQTLLQIKRNLRYKDIPIMILSTSENENEKRKCLSFGAIEYLVKPTTYDDGLTMVKRFTSFLVVESGT
jgi:CheY-like chemotaxis protein